MYIHCMYKQMLKTNNNNTDPISFIADNLHMLHNKENLQILDRSFWYENL